jgi:ketosteroid isomerase-like protein
MSVDEDRAALAQLQHDWMQAVQERDTDRLEEIVGDGFRFTAVHLNPEPMTRDQWMGAARDGYTILSFAYEHMDIDVFGDTGIVHARYSQVASYQHTPLSNVFRLTDIWHREADGWKVVARHSSVLG